MNNKAKKTLLIGLVALVVLGVILCAGCTSSQSTAEQKQSTQPTGDTTVQTINQPGAYSVNSGIKSVIIDSGDVTLNGGNLTTVTITKNVGESDVTLNGVTATTLNINGGGVNSIHLKNSTIQNAIVDKKGTISVRLAVESGSQVANLKADSDMTLEGAVTNLSIKTDNVTVTATDASLKTATMTGNEDILILGNSENANSVELKGNKDKVILYGTANAVSISGTDDVVELRQKAETVNVSETAVNPTIIVPEGASVGTMNLDAMTNVTGNGSIDKVVTNDSSNLNSTITPKNVENTAEQKTEEKQQETTKPKSGGGGSGKAHQHTFDTSKWVADNDGHWHAATCGHDVKGDYAKHTIDKSGKCSECGYKPGMITEIKSVEDFKEFIDTVNSGVTYDGVTVTLLTNLDFDGGEIYPIGNMYLLYDKESLGNEGGIAVKKIVSNPFKGTFDGKGKNISNFVVKQDIHDIIITDEESGEEVTYRGVGIMQGLFGLTDNATFKELNIEKETIYTEEPVLSVSYDDASNILRELSGYLLTGTDNLTLSKNIIQFVANKTDMPSVISGGLIGAAAGDLTIDSVSINSINSGTMVASGLVGATTPDILELVTKLFDLISSIIPVSDKSVTEAFAEINLSSTSEEEEIPDNHVKITRVDISNMNIKGTDSNPFNGLNIIGAGILGIGIQTSLEIEDITIDDIEESTSSIDGYSLACGVSGGVISGVVPTVDLGETTTKLNDITTKITRLGIHNLEIKPAPEMSVLAGFGIGLSIGGIDISEVKVTDSSIKTGEETGEYMISCGLLGVSLADLSAGAYVDVILDGTSLGEVIVTLQGQNPTTKLSKITIDNVTIAASDNGYIGTFGCGVAIGSVDVSNFNVTNSELGKFGLAFTHMGIGLSGLGLTLNGTFNGSIDYPSSTTFTSGKNLDPINNTFNVTDCSIDNNSNVSGSCVAMVGGALALGDAVNRLIPFGNEILYYAINAYWEKITDVLEMIGIELEDMTAELDVPEMYYTTFDVTNCKNSANMKYVVTSMFGGHSENSKDKFIPGAVGIVAIVGPYIKSAEISNCEFDGIIESGLESSDEVILDDIYVVSGIVGLFFPVSGTNDSLKITDCQNNGTLCLPEDGLVTNEILGYAGIIGGTETIDVYPEALDICQGSTVPVILSGNTVVGSEKGPYPFAGSFYIDMDLEYSHGTPLSLQLGYSDSISFDDNATYDEDPILYATIAGKYSHLNGGKYIVNDTPYSTSTFGAVISTNANGKYEVTYTDIDNAFAALSDDKTDVVLLVKGSADTGDIPLNRVVTVPAGKTLVVGPGVKLNISDEGQLVVVGDNTEESVTDYMSKARLNVYGTVDISNSSKCNEPEAEKKPLVIKSTPYDNWEYLTIWDNEETGLLNVMGVGKVVVNSALADIGQLGGVAIYGKDGNSGEILNKDGESLIGDGSLNIVDGTIVIDPKIKTQFSKIQDRADGGYLYYILGDAEISDEGEYTVGAKDTLAIMTHAELKKEGELEIEEPESRNGIVVDTILLTINPGEDSSESSGTSTPVKISRYDDDFYIPYDKKYIYLTTLDLDAEYITDLYAGLESNQHLATFKEVISNDDEEEEKTYIYELDEDVEGFVEEGKSVCLKGTVIYGYSDKEGIIGLRKKVDDSSTCSDPDSSMYEIGRMINGNIKFPTINAIKGEKVYIRAVEDSGAEIKDGYYIIDSDYKGETGEKHHNPIVKETVGEEEYWTFTVPDKANVYIKVYMVLEDASTS